MPLTLFYSPGACSLSCHIALEESALAYERRRFGSRDGGTESAEYRAINPRGRVPALGFEDGTLLTEAAAILGYVAEQVPEKKLLPASHTRDHARAREWMGFIASTVHPTFRTVFRPERFADSETAKQEVRAGGLRLLSTYFADIEERLSGRPYALGDTFSLVDAYLFVFHGWASRLIVRPVIAPMPAFDAIVARVAARPAVVKVLGVEALPA